MDIAAKQAELDALTWYHEFDFGNGLRTKTLSHQVEQHRRIWSFMESHLSGVDFRGKSVLDIGAWDGYWSFYAERRGARSVLASDDLGQNWSAGRGIHLAKELLGSNVEIDQNQSVYDLARRGQTFDVILFLGVYYHLHDPFHALAQIRHCCHEDTVLVIDGPVAVNLEPNEALYDFTNRQHEWLPTEGALQQLLTATYFTNAGCGYLDPPADPPEVRLGWRWRLGMIRRALRGERSAVLEHLRTVVLDLQTPRRPACRRLIATCRPFAGANPIHDYRPPFGLDAYDPRFRDQAPKRAAA